VVELAWTELWQSKLNEITWDKKMTFTFNFLQLFIAIGCGLLILDQPRSVGMQEGEATSRKVMLEDAEKFTNRITDLLAKGEFDQIEDCIDWEEIASRAMSEFELGDPAKKRMHSGLVVGIKSQNLYKLIGEQVRQGGTYRHLGFLDKEDGVKSVFRFLPATGGLNYHVLDLEKRDEQVVVSDIFVAATGEWMSHTIQQTLRTQLNIRPDAGSPLKNSQQETRAAMEGLATMAEFQKTGQFKEMLEEYAKLPESMQKSKIAFTLRMFALSIVGTKEEIEQASDEFVSLFPDDPSLDLMSIDSAFSRKDKQRLLKSVDSLINLYGDDDYLNAMVGSLLVTMDEKEEGLDRLKKIDLGKCDEFVVHDFVLTAALKTQEHEITLTALKLIHEKFGVRFQDLSQVEMYQHFANSPQFAEWKTFIGDESYEQ
jgi:hypothetical protein